jgi:probable H4MPT-linked C1 transfer pathway protein
MSDARIAALGWDIGGAHLKAVALAADRRVVATHLLPCPLWQGLGHLEQAARAVLSAHAGDTPVHAVTMTGELCDLFDGRADGVRRILDTLGHLLAPATPRVYALGGGLVPPPLRDPLAAASMNWHAMAEALAARMPEALLVDVGSTTTDVIAIAGGKPRTRGDDDRARLASDELVYQGVARTPVMALCARVPYRGAWQSMAAEYFATTADVYRLLGQLPAHADLLPSADGRAKTVELSAARLARMVGDDGGEDNFVALRELAAYLRDAQRGRLREAVERVSAGARPAVVVGAGVGRFLVREVAASLGLAYRDYAEALGVIGGDAANDCAPALGLASLALAA